MGIFEEFGIASVDGKPFEVLGQVLVPELEQKLNYYLFCFGSSEDNLLREVQAAVWTMKELLYLIEWWNATQIKKVIAKNVWCKSIGE